MRLSLTFLLSVSAALAAPYAPVANTQSGMTDMETMNTMPMNPMAIEPISPTSMKASKAPNTTVPLGNAIVLNNCEIPIYLWSVGQSISPQYVLQPGQAYGEYFRRDPQSGGIAIKITAVKHGLYTSAPQTVFAYNLVDNRVWYDLSDVFGDPFEGETVSVWPSEPAIRWEEGVPPRGSQVRLARADTDLILDVCGGMY